MKSLPLPRDVEDTAIAALSRPSVRDVERSSIGALRRDGKGCRPIVRRRLWGREDGPERRRGAPADPPSSARPPAIRLRSRQVYSSTSSYLLIIWGRHWDPCPPMGRDTFGGYATRLSSQYFLCYSLQAGVILLLSTVAQCRNYNFWAPAM